MEKTADANKTARMSTGANPNAKSLEASGHVQSPVEQGDGDGFPPGVYISMAPKPIYAGGKGKVGPHAPKIRKDKQRKSTDGAKMVAVGARRVTVPPKPKDFVFSRRIHTDETGGHHRGCIGCLSVFGGPQRPPIIRLLRRIEASPQQHIDPMVTNFECVPGPSGVAGIGQNVRDETVPIHNSPVSGYSSPSSRSQSPFEYDTEAESRWVEDQQK